MLSWDSVLKFVLSAVRVLGQRLEASRFTLLTQSACFKLIMCPTFFPILFPCLPLSSAVGVTFETAALVQTSIFKSAAQDVVLSIRDTS
jgi:hypothetical protein